MGNAFKLVYVFILFMVGVITHLHLLTCIVAQFLMGNIISYPVLLALPKIFSTEWIHKVKYFSLIIENILFYV